MAAKKPTPAPDDSGVQINDYVCAEPIMHNGKRMMPGDLVSLAEDDPLVVSGAVAPATATPVGEETVQ